MDIGETRLDYPGPSVRMKEEWGKKGGQHLRET